MKRNLMSFATGLVMLALCVGMTACSLFNQTTGAASQQSAAQKLATLKADIAKGCLVAQPVLTSMVGVEPYVAPNVAVSLDKIANASSGFCQASGTINTDDLQDFINSGATAIVQAVNNSGAIDAKTKPLIIAAIVALQGSVGLALLNYGPVPAAPAAPASTATVATS